MSIIKGRSGSLYFWNGAVTSMVTEATTESTNTAQITDAAKRMISPNHSQVWTDSGGKTVIHTDYLNGIATFNGNVGTVTVTGSYIPSANIIEVAQIYGWKLDMSIEIKDATCLGDTSKVKLADLKDWKGTIDQYWLDSAFYDMWRQYQVGGTSIAKWLVKLFIDEANTKYYRGFCFISGVSENVSVNEFVKSAITFEGTDEIEYKTS